MSVKSGSYQSGTVESFTYNLQNQRTGYQSSNKKASYAYGADGLRKSKTVNNVMMKYVWDRGNLAAEVSGSTIVNMYDYGPDGITSRETSNGDKTLYLKNAHGDLVGMSDTNGNVSANYRYDAFGNVLSESMPDRFGYCGEFFDNESGLVYLRNRYYDSTTGRFISEDPVKDGLNWYSYADNNPIMLVDPWGLDAQFYYSIYSDIQYVYTEIENILTAKLQYEYIVDNYFEDDYNKVLNDWSQEASEHRNNILNSRLLNSCPELKSVFEGVLSQEGGGSYEQTLALKCALENFQTQIVDGVNNQPFSFLNGVPEGTSLSINEGAIYASYANNVCFVGGTLVATADGEMSIQDIQIGDYVYSIDEFTGELALKKVTHTFENTVFDIVNISYGEVSVQCTKEHPFWVMDKGWVIAENLKPGDKCISYTGQEFEIENVEITHFYNPVPVYNLEVDDFHTYCVAELGILVHNVCMTNKQAVEAASALGFTEVKGQYSHGQKIFTNGKVYITIDADSHSGGTWKMANTIKNLSSKSTRMGTYDEDLVRIGD